MATIAPTRSATSPPPSPPLHRITVDEYDRITASGALEDPGRVELIDGYMVDKMAKNPGHSFSTIETYQALTTRLPAGWSARQEQPVRIPAYNEPEPDVAVVRGINADYRRRRPTPADVALLVEVADSTLSQDRGVKLVAYATDGIPVYWIVNLVDRQIEVHTDPGPSGYTSRTVYQAGATVPIVIDGQEIGRIAVETLLP